MEAVVTDVGRLTELSQQVRADSVRLAAMVSSGHPTSSMSAADLMVTLFDRHLRYDFANPSNPQNDHVVFSKGHASPLLYSLYRAAGVIDEAEFKTYRQLGSRLEGHPTPVLPWVDVATGSLGQGLANGVGLALVGKRLDRLPYTVWVLCGDSEMAEGSMWEAVEHAGFWELDNLVAIIDVNRLGQRGETMYGWNTQAFADRIGAFGWHTIVIDGHDIGQIDAALGEARTTTGRPTAIIAKTAKGRGVQAVENLNGQHGKPLPDAEAAIAELGGLRDLRIEVMPPDDGPPPHRFDTPGAALPAYHVGSEVATRLAYGEALAALGHSRGDIVAIDGETGNSTYAEIFGNAHPERFFEAYISEQLAVAAATGMQVRGWTPFVSSFASFLTRAYDFVRMAPISRANVRFVGSHAGVSIGEDGPSQMGTEDLAMFRAVHGSTVLYPSDGNQTVDLVRQMADREGVVYMRTGRPAQPVIYEPGESFPIGGSRVLRATADDQVTLIGAGITLTEALKAAEQLAGEGIPARVIDLYSIKPVDVEALSDAAGVTGRLVTVEDHLPEGGLGDAVLEAFTADDSGPLPRVRKLAIRELMGSATPAEQIVAAGIDAASIAGAAQALIGT